MNIGRQHEYFRSIEEHVLPLVVEDAKKLLDTNYASLSPQQKGALNDVFVLRGSDPRIIGHGEHQIAISSGPYNHLETNRHMCVKFAYDFDVKTLRDVLTLGGDIQNVPEGLAIRCPYFILNSIASDSDKIARELRAISLYVPFTQTIKIGVMGHSIYATMAEDVSEGGGWNVENADAYARRTGDKDIGHELDKLVDYLLKNTDLKPETHFHDNSKELALRHIFFVRTKGAVKEIVAGDFDHVG